MSVRWPGVWHSHINERVSNILGLSPRIMLGLRQQQPGKLSRSFLSQSAMQINQHCAASAAELQNCLTVSSRC